MNHFCFPESQWKDAVGHLDELRRRMIVCGGVFLAAAVLLSFFGGDLLRLLETPARGVVQEFIFTGPAEAFGAYVRVVVLGAGIICCPVILFQAWAFLAPAVSPGSRRYAAGWFSLSLASFLAGIMFSYGVLLPSAFKFLVDFGEGFARPMISLSQYISFATAIIFWGGCLFEIPCLMGFLSVLGILNSRRLSLYHRHAIVGMLILAAVTTPTQDPANMLLVALPMILLFELGVIVCTTIERKRT